MARRLRLPNDWLNDAVRDYLIGADREATVVYEGRSLQVAVASPEYVLAMKLLSASPNTHNLELHLWYSSVDATGGTGTGRRG